MMDCLTLLQQDIESWNQWRANHPGAPCLLNALDLRQGYFFEGNFSSVDLSRTDLRRACLIGANFKYANLMGADLSEAYLGDADFTGANLSGANLAGAHVDRANFTQAVGLTVEQWAAVAENREPVSDLPVETSVETADAHQLQDDKMLSNEISSDNIPSAKRVSLRDRNIYETGIRRALTRLRLGPISHEKKLFRMMTSTPLSRS